MSLACLAVFFALGSLLCLGRHMGFFSLGGFSFLGLTRCVFSFGGVSLLGQPGNLFTLFAYRAVFWHFWVAIILPVIRVLPVNSLPVTRVFTGPTERRSFEVDEPDASRYHHSQGVNKIINPKCNYLSCHPSKQQQNLLSIFLLRNDVSFQDFSQQKSLLILFLLWKKTETRRIRFAAKREIALEPRKLENPIS